MPNKHTSEKRSVKFTELQLKILDVLGDELMTCDDIAWKLNSHKMHVGNSVKSLLLRNIVGVYHTDYSNPKYYNKIINKDGIK